VQILVSNIRALKISERKIKADRDAAVKKIDEGCGPHLERIEAEIERDMKRCQTWAEDHPEEFAERKSIEFTHGVLGFRTGTPKLVMTKRAGGWKGALERVMQFLPSFIRDTPEIDKEALIAQRAEAEVQYGLKQCGLAVEQAEAFFVEPKITEVETRETSEVVS
jgi:phage host-nuclease inhibitor protein Gam